MVQPWQNQQLSDQFLNELKDMSTDVIRNNFFDLFKQALHIEEDEEKQHSEIQENSSFDERAQLKTQKLL